MMCSNPTHRLAFCVPTQPILVPLGREKTSFCIWDWESWTEWEIVCNYSRICQSNWHPRPFIKVLQQHRVPDVFCNVGSDPQEEWKRFKMISITRCAVARSAGDGGCVPAIKQVVLTITDSRQCVFADYPHQVWKSLPSPPTWNFSVSLKCRNNDSFTGRMHEVNMSGLTLWSAVQMCAAHHLHLHLQHLTT